MMKMISQQVVSVLDDWPMKLNNTRKTSIVT